MRLVSSDGASDERLRSASSRKQKTKGKHIRSRDDKQ